MLGLPGGRTAEAERADEGRTNAPWERVKGAVTGNP
jgi:hypothetical protein